MKGRVLWWLLLLFCLLISAYALMLVAVRPPEIRERFAAFPLAAYVHFFGGAVALALGPFQFRPTLRAKRLALHRALGRVYVASVLVSGMAGLVLAFRSQGGVPAHLGFGALAVLWVVTGSLAWRRIVARDVASHRDWMVRNFSLTLAALTLRIYLPLSLLAGVPFPYAYAAISWLCWVPNLLVAEWLVEHSRLASAARPQVAR
jgi:uncharacterized membrane protein